MGRRGPPPDPTTIKIKKGNPGKRKINTQEPTPEVEAPECPDFLNDQARAEWERIVPILIENKVLSRMDLAGLAGYCQWYSRWQAAEADLKDGAYYKSKGREYPKAALKISLDASRMMHRFITEFGLTPSSRTRVQIDKPKPGDDFAAFRASRPA